MTHVHRLIRARAGFTLLEMLLGATVLAILAKTMVAATSTRRRRSDISRQWVLLTVSWMSAGRLC